jgi:porin
MLTVNGVRGRVKAMVLTRFAGVCRRPLIIVLVTAGLGVAGARANDSAKDPLIWDQDTLTGDWGGARTTLKNKSGIDITLNYVGESLAVLAGGLQRRASYEGRLEFSVDTDLQKLIGWTGGSTHFTIYQLHDGGRNAEDGVGSNADPSNIDALPTTRLFTAWFQQNFFEDRFSVRMGKIAADDEFIGSPTSSGLINSTFGWASVLANNMTNGGPVYPLATPGVRIAIKPTEQLTVQSSVFSGDPAGRYCNDIPQECNKYGTTFSFSGGALWMGELQYSFNQGKQAAGLPGVYKLGGWYATTDFADQHFGLDAAGGVVSLADPTVTGPLNRHSDWGLYAVADQMIWRSAERSLNLFVRGGFAPSDRNLISYYVDGGAGIKGMLPGRPQDVFTFGVAYARISRDAASLDQDTRALNGSPFPIRDAEVVLELSYEAQIAPWWTVQPDLQYIFHPRGSVPDPNNANLTVGNAVVAGIRSTIKF